MNVERAVELAKEMNRTGKHKEEWHYYPALHDSGNWFVMRRRKRAELCVAVYVDGKTSVREA
ncbi:hypothetical protein Milano_070 [Agrobacterium phage Milano]|nr:hypothetical protein Milano_070 [Agrobacterium phage Milano]